MVWDGTAMMSLHVRCSMHVEFVEGYTGDIYILCNGSHNKAKLVGGLAGELFVGFVDRFVG